MIRCKNCGKEFKTTNKCKKDKRGNRNYLYCCIDCYWQYHLKDILKGNKNGKK